MGLDTIDEILKSGSEEEPAGQIHSLRLHATQGSAA